MTSCESRTTGKAGFLSAILLTGALLGAGEQALARGFLQSVSPDHGPSGTQVLLLTGNSTALDMSRWRLVFQDSTAAVHPMRIGLSVPYKVYAYIPDGVQLGRGAIVLLKPNATVANSEHTIAFNVDAVVGGIPQGPAAPLLKPSVRNNAGVNQPFAALPGTAKTQLPPMAASRCPDPAADRIDARILLRKGLTRGQVEIVGVVRNLGGAYESSPNQQEVLLYENAGIVARQAFQNLAPGGEVRVRITRDWLSSTEFPPDYRLVIQYGPDIRIDNNPKNDDCQPANNTRQLGGRAINALFVHGGG